MTNRKPRMYFFDKLKAFTESFLPNIRNCTERTISTYKQSLKALILFFKEHKGQSFDKLSFKDLSYSTISEFVIWLRDKHQASSATVNLRLVALKSFLKYCAEADDDLAFVYHDVSKVHGIRHDVRRRIEYLTQKQVKLLFEMPDITTGKGRRDRFFLIFLYQTGMRLQEILSVTFADLLITGDDVRVRIFGKGHKERIIPVLKDAKEHLWSYLNEFHKNHDLKRPLFYTKHNLKATKMSAGAVNTLMRKYAKQAHEVDPLFPLNLHPHMLRHSIAMAMYKNGIPISHIRDILGHSNIQTTMIYANSDDEIIYDSLSKTIDGMIPTPENIDKRVMEEQELLRYCGLA